MDFWQMRRQFWAQMFWIAVASCQVTRHFPDLHAPLSSVWYRDLGAATLWCCIPWRRIARCHLCQLTLDLLLPASSFYFWKISFYPAGAWGTSVVLVLAVLAASREVSRRLIGLLEPHMMLFMSRCDCTDQRHTGARRTQALYKPHLFPGFLS